MLLGMDLIQLARLDTVSMVNSNQIIQLDSHVTLSLVILILRVPPSPQCLHMNTSFHSLSTDTVIYDLSIDL